MSSFFFNDTATTEIYTLSLHDALPICAVEPEGRQAGEHLPLVGDRRGVDHVVRRDAIRGDHQQRVARLVHLADLDRKSTRLNSSHANISYAVFCLKKKKQTNNKHVQQH